MRTGSRRHRISTVFQIPGRRADSLRIGRYTNFLDITYINGESIPSAVLTALAIRDVLALALSIACLIVYLNFCLDVVSTQSIFTRKQCRRLLVVGLLLLISSIVSITLDNLCAIQLPNDVSITTIGIFGFNAWTLVLALFALSLSAIFEYGRLLQSDVDAII